MRSPAPPPLWRFVLVAAVVVVAAGSIVFARRAGPPDLKIVGKVSGTPTPTAQRPDTESTPPAQAAFLGSGSWTMSSVPSCFRERERISGTVAQLRPQFPPSSERLRPPGVVSAGDCTVVVGDHELLIMRGADRLRVPPQADLYRNRAGLTLVYVHGNHAEIRRY